MFIEFLESVGVATTAMSWHAHQVFVKMGAMLLQEDDEHLIDRDATQFMRFSIDQLENKGRRVIYGTPENATAAGKLLDRQMSVNGVPKMVQQKQVAMVVCCCFTECISAVYQILPHIC